MTKLLLVLLAVGILASTGVSAAAHRVHSANAPLHCGSFKLGPDGLPPGPSGITATNTSCWFARAVALLGPAPGWRCHLVVGLLFTCRHGNQTVGFIGL